MNERPPKPRNWIARLPIKYRSAFDQYAAQRIAEIGFDAYLLEQIAADLAPPLLFGFSVYDSVGLSADVLGTDRQPSSLDFAENQDQMFARMTRPR